MSTAQIPSRVSSSRTGLPNRIRSETTRSLFHMLLSWGRAKPPLLCVLFCGGKAYSIGYGTNRIARIQTVQNHMRKNLIFWSYFLNRNHGGNTKNRASRACNENPSYNIFFSGSWKVPVFRLPQGTGCCWLIQWTAPSPFTSARQSTPITSRSGKSDARIAFALVSCGWSNTGMSTALLVMRKFA